MDQDDRPDANTNTDKETSAPQASDITSSTPENSTGAMTHSKPEIGIRNSQANIEPAGINTIEMTAVSSEIEPSTVAYKPDETSSDVSAQAPVATAAEAKAVNSQEVTAPTASPAVSKSDKKRLVIAILATLALFAIIGTLAWWLLGGNSKESSDQSSNILSTPIEQPKLGVALTVVDGTVEFAVNETEWQVATTDTELEEGNMIRTSSESRAVLALDDGSALRLDASTQVELTDLSVNNVEIKLVEGSAYSRVVPSDRTYVVAVDETNYEAMGTAFVTVNTEEESGVQVYQSSVKTSDSEEAVTEGKQYYKTNSDAALQGKLTDINIDTLVEDAFVNWNLTQDESDTNFKDKLGILPQIKERGAALEAERKTQAAQEEAARFLKEKQEAAEKEAQQKSETNRVTRGVMTLGVVGKKLSWTYTGKAVHGYKLVYSKKTATPTFGNNDSIYFSSIDETTGELPSKDKIGGGIYYVRACAYTANTEDEGCVDYSNMVVINI